MNNSEKVSLKLSWYEIVHFFNTKFDEAFLTSQNTKAHFDFSHETIDGAKEKWKNLLILDAVMCYCTNRLPRDKHKFDHHEMLRAAVISVRNKIAESSSNQQHCIIKTRLTPAKYYMINGFYDGNFGSKTTKGDNDGDENYTPGIPIAITSQRDQSALISAALCAGYKSSIFEASHFSEEQLTLINPTNSAVNINGCGGDGDDNDDNNDDFGPLCEVHYPWANMSTFRQHTVSQNRAKPNSEIAHKRQHIIKLLCNPPFLQNNEGLINLLNDYVLKVLEDEQMLSTATQSNGSGTTVVTSTADTLPSPQNVSFVPPSPSSSSLAVPQQQLVSHHQQSMAANTTSVHNESGTDLLQSPFINTHGNDTNNTNADTAKVSTITTQSVPSSGLLLNYTGNNSNNSNNNSSSTNASNSKNTTNSNNHVSGRSTSSNSNGANNNKNSNNSNSSNNPLNAAYVPIAQMSADAIQSELSKYHAVQKHNLNNPYQIQNQHNNNLGSASILSQQSQQQPQPMSLFQQQLLLTQINSRNKASLPSGGSSGKTNKSRRTTSKNTTTARNASSTSRYHPTNQEIINRELQLLPQYGAGSGLGSGNTITQQQMLRMRDTHSGKNSSSIANTSTNPNTTTTSNYGPAANVGYYGQQQQQPPQQPQQQPNYATNSMLAGTTSGTGGATNYTMINNPYVLPPPVISQQQFTVPSIPYGMPNMSPAQLQQFLLANMNNNSSTFCHNFASTGPQRQSVMQTNSNTCGNFYRDYGTNKTTPTVSNQTTDKCSSSSGNGGISNYNGLGMMDPNHMAALNQQYHSNTSTTAFTTANAAGHTSNSSPTFSALSTAAPVSFPQTSHLPAAAVATAIATGDSLSTTPPQSSEVLLPCTNNALARYTHRLSAVEALFKSVTATATGAATNSNTVKATAASTCDSVVSAEVQNIVKTIDSCRGQGHSSSSQHTTTSQTTSAAAAAAAAVNSTLRNYALKSHMKVGSWCAPGRVVGIYDNGIGPPSDRAIMLAVVTRKRDKKAVTKETVEKGINNVAAVGDTTLWVNDQDNEAESQAVSTTITAASGVIKPSQNSTDDCEVSKELTGSLTNNNDVTVSETLDAFQAAESTPKIAHIHVDTIESVLKHVVVESRSEPVQKPQPELEPETGTEPVHVPKKRGRKSNAERLRLKLEAEAAEAAEKASDKAAAAAEKTAAETSLKDNEAIVAAAASTSASSSGGGAVTHPEDKDIDAQKGPSSSSKGNSGNMRVQSMSVIEVQPTLAQQLKDSSVQSIHDDDKHDDEDKEECKDEDLSLDDLNFVHTGVASIKLTHKADVAQFLAGDSNEFVCVDGDGNVKLWDRVSTGVKVFALALRHSTVFNTSYNNNSSNDDCAVSATDGSKSDNTKYSTVLGASRSQQQGVVKGDISCLLLPQIANEALKIEHRILENKLVSTQQEVSELMSVINTQQGIIDEHARIIADQSVKINMLLRKQNLESKRVGSLSVPSNSAFGYNNSASSSTSSTARTRRRVGPHNPHRRAQEQKQKQMLATHESHINSDSDSDSDSSLQSASDHELHFNNNNDNGTIGRVSGSDNEAGDGGDDHRDRGRNNVAGEVGVDVSDDRKRGRAHSDNHRQSHSRSIESIESVEGVEESSSNEESLPHQSVRTRGRPRRGDVSLSSSKQRQPDQQQQQQQQQKQQPKKKELSHQSPVHASVRGSAVNDGNNVPVRGLRRSTKRGRASSRDDYDEDDGVSTKRPRSSLTKPTNRSSSSSSGVHNKSTSSGNPVPLKFEHALFTLPATGVVPAAAAAVVPSVVAGVGDKSESRNVGRISIVGTQPKTGRKNTLTSTTTIATTTTTNRNRNNTAGRSGRTSAAVVSKSDAAKAKRGASVVTKRGRKA